MPRKSLEMNWQTADFEKLPNELSRPNTVWLGSDFCYCEVWVVVEFILQKQRHVYRGILKVYCADELCKY